jgi:hypothetical protein
MAAPFAMVGSPPQVVELAAKLDEQHRNQGDLMATQLRRYTIAEDQMDRMVAWFPSIIPAREKYGFRIEFAYADRGNNQFVWAVSHDGDFDAALAEYNDSPERKAAFVGFESPVTDMTVGMVDQVV